MMAGAGIACLLLAFLLAVLVTRSITRPLALHLGGVRQHAPSGVPADGLASSGSCGRRHTIKHGVVCGEVRR
jgi:hypothetical protein